MTPDRQQLPDHSASGAVGTDTTPHYCAGCGRVGCVATWKAIASEHGEEIRRLRAENERLRRRLLGIDRACAEFQGRGKIVPAAIYDAVRASQTPAASDEDGAS